MYHMVGHPRCVFINYIWLDQLSNRTNNYIPLPLVRGFQPEYKHDAPDTETGNQES